jgi:hypothetical protein
MDQGLTACPSIVWFPLPRPGHFTSIPVTYLQRRAHKRPSWTSSLSAPLAYLPRNGHKEQLLAVCKVVVEHADDLHYKLYTKHRRHVQLLWGAVWTNSTSFQRRSCRFVIQEQLGNSPTSLAYVGSRAREMTNYEAAKNCRIRTSKTSLVFKRQVDSRG